MQLSACVTLHGMESGSPACPHGAWRSVFVAQHLVAERIEEALAAAGLPQLAWYDVLLTVADTPVARLNRAVAVGERDGPAAGLAAVDAVADLEGYPLWHAARAELLARLGRRAEAGDAYAAAIAVPQDEAQLTHLRRRRALLDPAADPARSG